MRARLLAWFLALGLLVPLRSVGADDPPTPPAGGPPPAEGTGEKKDGEKKDGEKEGEKKPDEKPKPADGEEEEPAPAPREEGPAPETKGFELFQPPEAGPGGMGWVPAHRAIIGSTPSDVAGLTAGRDDQTRVIVMFEIRTRPTVYPVGDFFFDLTEVTNAQYALFLKEYETTYDTSKGAVPNLAHLAGELLSLQKDKIEEDNVAWRQIYQGNRQTLWDAMSDKIVKNAAGEVDEVETEKAFRFAPLAKGMVLRYFRRQPPDDWPGIEPDPAELNRPVRYVSYNDAEAFAEWAGKHIPSEEEWEYCARGPEGRTWPWGDVWPKEAQGLESKFANWGGKFVNKKFKPIAVDVDDSRLVMGRSWMGAWHMIGNVGEWTSSWFEKYPGGHPKAEHGNLNSYVKVIRGGTLNDQDPIALRSASRNFIGRGVEAPPVPTNRFEFVGFRCGWYLQPGSDQFVAIRRRVKEGRRVLEADLAANRVGGAVATQFIAWDATPVNGVTVTGRAKSLVAVPLKSLFRADDKNKDHRVRNLKELLELSEGDDPIPLAAIQTDLPLKRVWVRAPPDPKAKPKPGGRRKQEAPAVVEGTALPGTYLIALQHHRLCLVTPTFEWICFLSDEIEKSKLVRIDALKPNEDKTLPPVPPTTMMLDPDDDVSQIRFHVPIGGHEDAGNDPKQYVMVGAILNTAPGSLKAAGTWRTSK